MCPVEEQTTGAPQEEHADDHQADVTNLHGPHGTIHASHERGYMYVSKFTDDYSRMKEVYLLRKKSEAAESLHKYNMTVAVLLGLRIEIARSPHSALGGATPYFRMHNEEADLSGLRAIGARAFVHHGGSWTTGRSKESCADSVKTAEPAGSTTQPRARWWKAAR